MAKGQIQYTIAGGDLPVGVRMEPNTGALMGNLSPENVGAGPVWNGPDNGAVLGSANVGDNVNFTAINVAPRAGKTLAGVAVVGRRPLPWGLRMEPKTGAITGKVAELKGEQLNQTTNTNPPLWVTQFGTLASFSESATVNLTVAATPQASKTHRSYTVASGGLPWGLSLDPRSGKITGTALELKAPGFDLGLSPSVLTPPVWTTLPGTLKVFNETDVLSTANANTITLAASGQAGKTMASYRVIGGALPWGFGIDPRTGVISGTAAEVKLATDPVYYDHTKDPVLSNSVTVNGTSMVLTSDGSSLGSFAKGAAVSAQMVVQPYAGRTARAHLVNGTLPIGLTFDSTGKIQGTIATTKYVTSGVYNFTVRVVDNIQAYSLRAYSITVQ